MRLIIAGSRKYGEDNRAHAEYITSFLDFILENWNLDTILCGECPTGVDKVAKGWAFTKSLPYEPYPANWKKRGKAAGPLRNQAMIDADAHALAAFPGPKSKGTADIIHKALRARLMVFVVPVSE